MANPPPSPTSSKTLPPKHCIKLECTTPTLRRRRRHKDLKPTRERSTRSRELIKSMSGKSILGGQYKLLYQLGRGAFGVTYLADDNRRLDKEYVAIKVQKRECYDSSMGNKIIKNEVKFLKKITGHENVVTFRGEHIDSSYAYLVTQFYKGQTLWDKIHHLERGIRLPTVKKIFRQIVKGVMHIHSLDVAHRDLKPDNIIIDNANTARIIDFGFACNLHEKRDDRFGTAEYMAPEIYSGEPYDCARIDIWALGVILLEMVTAKLAWKKAHKDDPEYKTYCKEWKEDVACLREFKLFKGKLDTHVAAAIGCILTPKPGDRMKLGSVEWAIDNLF